ncbi:unnamed protein product [Linum trigynum]|uniref:Uncharacterized protein n=1 Tax=Linum trigynum TaxID=586398 RepID=A0AAV2EC75_9ROSI
MSAPSLGPLPLSHHRRPTSSVNNDSLCQAAYSLSHHRVAACHSLFPMSAPSLGPLLGLALAPPCRALANQPSMGFKPNTAQLWAQQLPFSREKLRVLAANDFAINS